MTEALHILLTVLLLVLLGLLQTHIKMEEMQQRTLQDITACLQLAEEEIWKKEVQENLFNAASEEHSPFSYSVEFVEFGRMKVHVYCKNHLTLDLHDTYFSRLNDRFRMVYSYLNRHDYRDKTRILGARTVNFVVFDE